MHLKLLTWSIVCYVYFISFSHIHKAQRVGGEASHLRKCKKGRAGRVQEGGALPSVEEAWGSDDHSFTEAKNSLEIGFCQFI